MPDEDDLADKYAVADERLAAAGLELVRGLQLGARRGRPGAATTSSTGPARDWWGVGPGAHSHVGGVRWWNVKHPAAYAERIAAGVSPAHGRELLDDETRRVERVLLELRLRDGLPARRPRRRPAARRSTGRSSGAGVVERRPAGAHPRGRLLADARGPRPVALSRP